MSIISKKCQAEHQPENHLMRNIFKTFLANTNVSYFKKVSNYSSAIKPSHEKYFQLSNPFSIRSFFVVFLKLETFILAINI
jgi:hypothetical protein